MHNLWRHVYHPHGSFVHQPHIPMRLYEQAGAFRVLPFSGDLDPPNIEISPDSSATSNYPDSPLAAWDPAYEFSTLESHFEEAVATIEKREGLLGVASVMKRILEPYKLAYSLSSANTFAPLRHAHNLVYGRTGLGTVYDPDMCREPDGQRMEFVIGNEFRLELDGEVNPEKRRPFSGTHFNLLATAQEFLGTWDTAVHRMLLMAARAGLNPTQAAYQHLVHHNHDNARAFNYLHPILSRDQHALGEIAYQQVYYLGFVEQAELMRRILRIRFYPLIEAKLQQLRNDGFLDINHLAGDQEVWTRHIPGFRSILDTFDSDSDPGSSDIEFIDPMDDRLFAASPSPPFLQPDDETGNNFLANYTEAQLREIADELIDFGQEFLGDGDNFWTATRSSGPRHRSVFDIYQNLEIDSLILLRRHN
ncbi:hypothetical protein MIND_00882200 [Mycena indigotica]|nr:uncharacterized protein MIND_00882200 [Mycena indigotica]KAF7299330.1 hypothetical protein MIND_00882200 [Mycena indigotica]